jgi:EAL domain-containing protein (putative c-di-GMP-specific phosphodiesterase class I)
MRKAAAGRDPSSSLPEEATEGHRTGRVLDEEDNAILLSIIDLAHNLGLKVVAGGLENQGIKERLAALGCDAVQGYCLSPPLSAADLPRWLRESPWRAKG